MYRLVLAHSNGPKHVLMMLSSGTVAISSVCGLERGEHVGAPIILKFARAVPADLAATRWVPRLFVVL